MVMLLRVGALVAIVFVTALVTGCREQSAPPGDRSERLRAVSSWSYQIQGLEEPGAVDALAATKDDLYVIEPTATVVGSEDHDMNRMLRSLKEDHALVLAYIDIGQAEEYRTYWKDAWRDTLIVGEDPEGWEGNHVVAFWESEWKDLWLASKKGIVPRLAEAGFDGVYLDWVEAYDDERVAERADEVDLDAAEEMLRFIEEIGEVGSKSSPGFLVVAQNAPYLLDEDQERYSAAVDAIAVEGSWFSGAADAEWGSPEGGDIANDSEDEWSTEALAAQSGEYIDRGIPVLSVDYSLDEGRAEEIYGWAREEGLVPLVTQVSLAAPTETPNPLERR